MACQPVFPLPIVFTQSFEPLELWFTASAGAVAVTFELGEAKEKVLKLGSWLRKPATPVR